MDSDVLPCDQDNKKEVYGYKPVGMMEYLVARSITGPGQIIFDPFMGTGSVGIGALRQNCPYIGIEILARRFFGALHRIAGELSEQVERFEKQGGN
jgi:DNA modification methylase